MRSLLFLLLAGCTQLPVEGYTWTREHEVSQVTIRVFETPLAGSMCSRWSGRELIACSAPVDDKTWVLYVPPNSAAIVAHECLHALGWSH